MKAGDMVFEIKNPDHIEFIKIVGDSLMGVIWLENGGHYTPIPIAAHALEVI